MDAVMIIGTHDGPFHADEILAYACLKAIFADPIELHRTRDPARLADCQILFDVGGIHDPENGRFDHHGSDVPRRPDGTPFSSFGLVWKAFGAIVTASLTDCTPETATLAAEHIDETFVRLIDLGDNGLRPKEADGLSALVESFNPAWKSDGDADGAFRHAAGFALRALIAQAVQAVALVEAERTVAGKLDTFGTAMMAREDFPALALAARGRLGSVQFHVFQRADGSWAARGVRPGIPIPPAWRGLDGPALAAVSGIADARYCHATIDFMVSATQPGLKAMIAGVFPPANEALAA